MKYLLIMLSFLIISNESIHGGSLPTGVVQSYSKTSNWDKEQHYVCIDLTFKNEDELTHFPPNAQFTLKLTGKEIGKFNLKKKALVLFLDESPDILVGKSFFHLQFEDNSKIYCVRGPTLTLTNAAWGLDDNTFMVTEASFPYLTLDGKTLIEATSHSDDILGKIFHATPVEELIQDNPGFSTFVYTSVDGKSYIYQIKPSLNLLWSPSNEQSERIVTVEYIGHIVTGMSNHFIAIVLSGGDRNYIGNGGRHHGTGTIIGVGPVGTPAPTWTKVGNRWMPIRSGVYLDLDTAMIIEIENGPTRTITKTW